MSHLLDGDIPEDVRVAGQQLPPGHGRQSVRLELHPESLGGNKVEPLHSLQGGRAATNSLLSYWYWGNKNAKLATQSVAVVFKKPT